MISHQDDAYLHQIACQAVDKLFDNVRNKKHMPANSQIYGLMENVRHYSAEVVLNEFIRHQKKKLSDNDRMGLSLWGSLEEQLTKGEVLRWAERDLPPPPVSPPRGSDNMHELLRQYNQAKKAWEDERNHRINMGFSVFITHFSCHYFYHLKS